MWIWTVSRRVQAGPKPERCGCACRDACETTVTATKARVDALRRGGERREGRHSNLPANLKLRLKWEAGRFQAGMVNNLGQN